MNDEEKLKTYIKNHIIHDSILSFDKIKEKTEEIIQLYITKLNEEFDKSLNIKNNSFNAEYDISFNKNNKNIIINIKNDDLNESSNNLKKYINNNKFRNQELSNKDIIIAIKVYLDNLKKTNKELSNKDIIVAITSELDNLKKTNKELSNKDIIVAIKSQLDNLKKSNKELSNKDIIVAIKSHLDNLKNVKNVNNKSLNNIIPIIAYLDSKISLDSSNNSKKSGERNDKYKSLLKLFLMIIFIFCDDEERKQIIQGNFIGDTNNIPIFYQIYPYILNNPIEIDYNSDVFFKLFGYNSFKKISSIFLIKCMKIFEREFKKKIIANKNNKNFINYNNIVFNNDNNYLYNLTLFGIDFRSPFVTYNDKTTKNKKKKKINKEIKDKILTSKKLCKKKIKKIFREFFNKIEKYLYNNHYHWTYMNKFNRRLHFPKDNNKEFEKIKEEFEKIKEKFEKIKELIKIIYEPIPEIYNNNDKVYVQFEKKNNEITIIEGTVIDGTIADKQTNKEITVLLKGETKPVSVSQTDISKKKNYR